MFKKNIIKSHLFSEIKYLEAHSRVIPNVSFAIHCSALNEHSYPLYTPPLNDTADSHPDPQRCHLWGGQAKTQGGCSHPNFFNLLFTVIPSLATSKLNVLAQPATAARVLLETPKPFNG